METEARSFRILFWYPGAEGSPEQAMPLLETWTQYISNQKSFQHKLKPAYQTESVQDGFDSLKKIKPTVGIISLEAYLATRSHISADLLAQTKSEPTGDGSQRYHLFKGKDVGSPTMIELSEPLGKDFVEKILFGGTALSGQHPPLHYADQILLILKRIGRGELKAAALLNAYEAAVLKRTSLPWTKNLVKIAMSPVLPSPPVVVFNDWKHDFPIQAFKEILFSMEKDPEGLEILQELRIRGFMEPNQAAYERLSAP